MFSLLQYTLQTRGYSSRQSSGDSFGKLYGVINEHVAIPINNATIIKRKCFIEWFDLKHCLLFDAIFGFLAFLFCKIRHFFSSPPYFASLAVLRILHKKTVNSCLYLRFAKTFNANKKAHGITVSISVFLRIKDWNWRFQVCKEKRKRFVFNILPNDYDIVTFICYLISIMNGQKYNFLFELF